MTTFLSNRDVYESVICGIVPQAGERLWIATADINDMYVGAGGRDMVSFVGGAGPVIAACHVTEEYGRISAL